MALPTTARAQFNVSKPITMIVPFPAGGGADILVRLLTKYLGENLGHPSSSRTSLAQAADSRSARWRRSARRPDARLDIDGFSSDGGHAVQPHVQTGKRLRSRLQCERESFVLVVNPQVPDQKREGVGRLAKAKPTRSTSPTTGRDADEPGGLNSSRSRRARGGAGRLSGRQLLGHRRDRGHVQGMFSNSPVALPHVAWARLGGLAVTSPKRSPAAPDLPTMAGVRLPGLQGRGLAGHQCTRWHPTRDRSNALMPLHAKRCRRRKW